MIAQVAKCRFPAPADTLILYARTTDHVADPFAVAEKTAPVARTPRLLDQVHAAIRSRHLSLRTEKAYVGWIRRFIFFSGKRHPRDMGEPEVARFLSHLAVEGRVSAST